jgi:hypothetical protein
VQDKELEELACDILVNQRSVRAGQHTVKYEKGTARGKDQIFYCEACGKTVPSSRRLPFADLYCEKAARPDDIVADEFIASQAQARKKKTARSRPSSAPPSANSTHAHPAPGGKLENAKRKWEDQKTLHATLAGRHIVDSDHAYGANFRCAACQLTRSWDKRKAYLESACGDDVSQRSAKSVAQTRASSSSTTAPKASAKGVCKRPAAKLGRRDR